MEMDLAGWLVTGFAILITGISKSGLAMMTKLFAVRLAGDGIGVYEIRPGIIETDMTAAMSGKAQKEILERVPAHRMGSGRDVAQLAAFLAGESAGYITGEVIRVDGGLCI